MLCILDGWGHREASADNAVALARAPHWRRIWAHAPHCLIETSGRAVGLPDGQMGNSEVGHMTIGSGRVTPQDLVRINAAVAGGELAQNPALARLAAKSRRVHLLGLLSPGGVHAHQDHMLALARVLSAQGVEVLVHAILDGRDTPPESAGDYLAAFEAAMPETCRIATLTGRYWAMDRDCRWARVARAVSAIVEGAVTPPPGAPAANAASAAEALAAARRDGETDEFVTPRLIGDFRGIDDGDGLLMANFRADRARQLLTALLDPDFDEYPMPRPRQYAAATGMVVYSEALNRFLDPVFAAHDCADTLGEIVAGAGLRQLRIAETEKYAHVTFFLNGGREAPFPGETRILVPSPDVATYDKAPEMSAPALTDALIAHLESGDSDLIVVNFANPDMVGHTGDLAAAIAAVECVDACLGRLQAALAAVGGAMLITADHGNLELMRDPETGAAHTAHTINPVPLVLLGLEAGRRLRPGSLADIAPTALALMGLAAPVAMTGRNLLLPAEATTADADRALG